MVVEVALQYLYSNEYFSLVHLSPFACYFFYMTNRLFSALCSWLITCFTIIRFMNIFRRFNTIRSNVILLTCLTTFFALANSYLIVTITYDENPKNQSTTEPFFNGTPCTIRAEYVNSNVTLLMNTLVAGFLSLAIPSILTFTVNVAIVCYIKHIYETKQSEAIPRRLETSSSSTSNYRSSRSTLLVISITYTACYLPNCILYLLRITFPQLEGTLSYYASVASLLRYISHSVNFYAYIFTNHRFRRDIIVLLRNVVRPCAYLKKRREVKRTAKQKTQYIYRHYRLPPSADSSNSGKLICVYQRPAVGGRIEYPNRLSAQQNVPSNEMIYQKQNTMLATLTPSQSMEKLRNRMRV